MDSPVVSYPGSLGVRVLHVHRLPYIGLQSLHEVRGAKLRSTDPREGVGGLEGSRSCLVFPRGVPTHSSSSSRVVNTTRVTWLHLVGGARWGGHCAGAGGGRGVGGGSGGGQAHRGPEVCVGVGEIRGEAKVWGVASVWVGGVVARVGRDGLTRQVGHQPRQVPGNSTLNNKIFH